MRKDDSGKLQKGEEEVLAAGFLFRKIGARHYWYLGDAGMRERWRNEGSDPILIKPKYERRKVK